MVSQVFEAVGLADEIVDRCFTGTTSRLRGTDYSSLYMDICRLHQKAYPANTQVGCSCYNNCLLSPQEGRDIIAKIIYTMLILWFDITPLFRVRVFIPLLLLRHTLLL